MPEASEKRLLVLDDRKACSACKGGSCAAKSPVASCGQSGVIYREFGGLLYRCKETGFADYEIDNRMQD